MGPAQASGGSQQHTVPRKGPGNPASRVKEPTPETACVRNTLGHMEWDRNIECLLHEVASDE